MRAALRQWPFFALGLIITLYRLYIIYTNGYNLYADEAQYWDWSRHLAWGYYSKPPVIAWVIALSTSLCGESEFCLRLPSPLLHYATSLMIFLTARSLYAARIALCSMLVYLTLPAVSFSAELITTDPILIFCWSLSLFFFVKALEKGQRIWWLLLGLAAGCGMLSKYSMLLFLPSSMVYLWLSPEHRPLLTSRNYWLSILTALLLYTPNIYWNYLHGFVSYLHTRDISNLQHALFHPLKLVEFIVAQTLIFGPLLFGIMATALFSIRKFSTDNNTKLLLSFILPLLLLITTLSLLSKAEANWAAPIYSTASILVVALAFSWSKQGLIYGSIVLHFLGMIVLYHYTPPLPSYKLDPRYRLKGWQEMGEAVSRVSAHYPTAGLLFDERKTMAEMRYYAKSAALNARKWNSDGIIQDHYDLTRDIKAYKGKNFLFISKLPTISIMPDYWQHISRLDAITIPVYPEYALHYNVYYLEGFKGY